MNPTQAFTGSATTFTAGDLSGVVAAGSTDAVVRFKNTSEVPIKLHVRKTGSSDDAPFDLTPGEYTADVWMSLTVARTLEYYIEGGGSISCEVVYYFGTGLTAVSNTTYTTAAKVASMLRLLNTSASPSTRLTLSGTTDPTLTEVEEWILEAESDIDAETNHSWKATTVTNEYHDVHGLYTGEYRRELPVKLKHRSIRAMTSGTDKIEIWDGTNWIDLVLAANGYIEGRANDYWVDYTNGIVYFVNTKPDGVRVTYRYGESSVPKDIQRICTLIAASNIIAADDYKASLPEGVSPKDIQARADAWRKEAYERLNKHKEILLA